MTLYWCAVRARSVAGCAAKIFQAMIRLASVIVRQILRVFFFFSSRRRHTRFDCDWSSDVCSSDLRPRLVTTTAEFHTIRRQLDRLAEEGIAVVKVSALPAATLAERLARTVDDRTAAVLVSAVLYENAHIVPNLAHVLEACRRGGAGRAVGASPAPNVVAVSVRTHGTA